jgi:NADH-quinone oxidoreductase subunit G
MATIHIDGKEYEVEGAPNLLEACLNLGLDVPYFCWHPALGSVGSCRQCAVKQFQGPDDKRGRMVMSCMVPTTNDMYISIDDAEAVEFRKSVNEWMMLNHPHDCPVCEEGGNCHLQDMTVMTGHVNRTSRFPKRTHENQELGPFISHEMNRCIACYRCVRYYKDYAGGTDFGVYGAHDNVYFGRTESGTLDSEFAGNLVEICPTGVFTDKTQSAHYNRKWDMQYAPSICQGCSLGCNISPGERYGQLRKIENRYHGGINHYFLCDRGRFGYDYVNADDRPYKAFRSHEGMRFELTPQDAVNNVIDVIRRSKKIAGIGSPRASVESNLLLKRWVGDEEFSLGIAEKELQALEAASTMIQHSGIATPTLRDIEACDAVLVLGEDLTQTAARMALALRQSVKNKAKAKAAAMKVDSWQVAAVATIGQRDLSPLYLTSLDATRLDDVATIRYHAAISDQARLGFAIAHILDPSAPAVTDADDALLSVARQIADGLAQAKRPLIISGTSNSSVTLLDAAANVAAALKKTNDAVALSLVANEVNSVGSALIGGLSVEAMLQRIAKDGVDTLVVVENDLYRRAPASLVDAALAKVENLIVLDHQNNAMVKRASWVLPAATFAEGDGTVINNEGRAQRFFQVFDPAYYDTTRTVHASWKWLYALQHASDASGVQWGQLDDVIAECASAVPVLKGMIEAAPNAKFRIKGLKIARSPYRYSGRTAQRANLDVNEPRSPQDTDSPFAFSMEGYNGTDNGSKEIPFAWAPGWNSPSAWNKFQNEVGGSLRAGDPGTFLFDSRMGLGLQYRTSIPQRYTPQDQLQIIANWKLFGSDELSQGAAPIQQRMAEPVLTLNQADAARLGLNDGAAVSFTWDNQSFVLTVNISTELAPGLAGLPLGIAPFSPAMLAGSISALQEVQK